MIKCFLRIQFGYVRALCMCLFGFVWAITCTFVHGFQNNLAKLHG